jgi:hypothetical protein
MVNHCSIHASSIHATVYPAYAPPICHFLEVHCAIEMSYCTAMNGAVRDDTHCISDPPGPI